MEQRNVPVHVGIIMDGNGRWAQKKGLSRSLGHKAGAANLKKLLPHILKSGVQCLSLYAFSSENFKRDPAEVEYLMNLFIENFEKEFSRLQKEGIRIVFSGRREPLREDVLKVMDEMTERSRGNDRAILNICINYGGQDEIVDMTKKIGTQLLNGELTISDITKDVVGRSLYHDLPPLDYVIRTSGEMRISNFMLWQSSYAEYYFPEVYFPDFNEKEFDLALSIYQNRDRRFGGVKK